MKAFLLRQKNQRSIIKLLINEVEHLRIQFCYDNNGYQNMSYRPFNY